MIKKNISGVLATIGACVFLSGCIGSGGEGTGSDYRPGFIDEAGFSSINYPEGYVPPRIVIDSPAPGSLVPADSSAVVLRGRVIAGEAAIDLLTLNGAAVPLGTDSGFEIASAVPSGITGYVCYELEAADANGYCGRERIALLLGPGVPVDTPSPDGVCVRLGSDAFDFAVKALGPVINRVLTERSFLDMIVVLLSSMPLDLEIREPFHALVSLTVRDIRALAPAPIGINMLDLRNPADPQAEAARICADLSIQGLELCLEVRFREVLDADMPKNLPPVNMTVSVGDMRAMLDMNIAAPDEHSLGLVINGLGTDINGMDIRLEDAGVFGGAVPIAIRKGTGSVIDAVLGAMLENLDLALLLPDEPAGMGLVNDVLDSLRIPMGAEAEPLVLGSLLDADFSALRFLPVLGTVRGDTQEMLLSLGGYFMASTGRSGTDYADYAEVLYLPPSATREEAITPRDDRHGDLALALSADMLNRFMASLADIDCVVSVPADELLAGLLPGISLPEHTDLDLRLAAPPILDFRNGHGMVCAPNLKVDLYMNGRGADDLMLSMAVDITADIAVSMMEREGSWYLDLELALPAFHVYFLKDVMGIHRMIDVEKAVGSLMPQIVDMLKAYLQTPLAVYSSQLEELLSLENLPPFVITVPELRMEDGYLSVFVDFD